MRARFLLPVLAVLVLGAVAAQAGSHAASVRVRYHSDDAVSDELPYDDGDISLGIAYEYFCEEAAYWQLGLGIAPNPSDLESGDFVVTPEVNLMFKDSFWRGGLGLLKSYISADDDDWTDVYWQVIFGVQFPATDDVELEVHTFYVFDDWAEIDEVDADDLEFALALRFRF